MIISTNSKPTATEFHNLISKTNALLNLKAKTNSAYFTQRKGLKLEYDVFEALQECAINSAFNNTIELVSGKKFPDIIANKFYGIEVKSTEKEQFTTLGGSILESTRLDGVERIYITFGKLVNPVEFISRPYEECLSGISVTHYPRYHIDMKLQSGKTIFDKMQTSYDKLRISPDIIAQVSTYYKSQLKKGQSLWWANDNIENSQSSAIIQLWTSLNKKEKEKLIIQGYSFFPEIAKSDYSRFALWLVTEHGVVNTNIRDSFSAGGKILLYGNLLPAYFGRIEKYKEQIKEIISSETKEVLENFWQVKIKKDRILTWIDLVSNFYSRTHKEKTEEILIKIM